MQKFTYKNQPENAKQVVGSSDSNIITGSDVNYGYTYCKREEDVSVIHLNRACAKSRQEMHVNTRHRARDIK